MLRCDFLNKRAKTALQAIIKALQLAAEIRQSTHVHTSRPASNMTNTALLQFSVSRKNSSKPYKLYLAEHLKKATMMNHNFCVSESKLFWSVARGECSRINGIFMTNLSQWERLSWNQKKLAGCGVCARGRGWWTLKVWRNNGFRTGNLGVARQVWQPARSSWLADLAFALINETRSCWFVLLCLLTNYATA